MNLGVYWLLLYKFFYLAIHTYNANHIRTYTRSSSDPTYSDKKEYKPVCTEEDREKFTFRLCVSCEEEGKSVPASGKCQVR